MQEEAHSEFKRRGADLLIEKEISLLEALTGIDFVLTHLDGRKIRIKNKPGEVIKSDDIKTVENHGMPYHKSPYKFGNLFVVFKVVFPDKLQKAQIDKIGEALVAQKKKGDVDMDVAETSELKAFQEHHRNTHHEGGQEGNGSDDEDEGHGHGGRQRVQCAQ